MFSNPDALLYLTGAILVEAHDERQTGDRSTSEGLHGPCPHRNPPSNARRQPHHNWSRHDRQNTVRPHTHTAEPHEPAGRDHRSVSDHPSSQVGLVDRSLLTRNSEGGLGLAASQGPDLVLNVDVAFRALR